MALEDMVDKGIKLLKEAVIDIKNLEVELIRKGVLTPVARRHLNDAAADMAALVVTADGSQLVWVVKVGLEYAPKIAEAHAEALGNLTAEEAELYNALVAKSRLEDDKS